MIIGVDTFEMGDSKEAALKPLEEAAEVFGAWQQLEGKAHIEVADRWLRSKLADEVADCIQACCNLADRYGIDMQSAMDRCHERNRARGRCE